MDTTKILIELAGWTGSVAIVGAYAGLSYGRLSPHSSFYQGLNFWGSIGLILNTGYYKAYPSMVVNIIWVAIAGWAWYTLYKKKQSVV
ncbi:CBU_0592 family membrane protein [Eisenibacter elegans]|jgi:hypothetical protein|uniref:CBU_0592 family membrane protein n=1 Tax=Eisenibacter elegans TaxID=997 RepID=UPI000411C7BA|nr:hypothetical protein [Eisenibacter elegans]